MKKRLRNVTLCFLVKPGKVLLAMKKRGFGQGKWNGVGGKVGENETIEQATVRETKEEIGVTPTSMEKVAVIDFYFPDIKEDKTWAQQVHVFFARQWQGEPTETEEMAPQWFKNTELPFESMWKDDEFWLPRVLAGDKLRGRFVFNDTGESIKGMKIKSVSGKL